MNKPVFQRICQRAFPAAGKPSHPQDQGQMTLYSTAVFQADQMLVGVDIILHFICVLYLLLNMHSLV